MGVGGGVSRGGGGGVRGMVVSGGGGVREGVGGKEVGG